MIKHAKPYYFSSVVHYTHDYDLVRVRLWDEAKADPFAEYVLIGVVDEDEDGPLVEALALFERARLDFRNWRGGDLHKAA